MSKEVQLPASIKDLAQYNVLAMIGLSIPIVPKNCQESREAGHHYITSVYPHYDHPEVRHKEFDFPKTDTEIDRYELSGQILREFDIGLALIRPEMFHVRGKMEDFLRKNGFQIVLSDERRVDSRSYGVLYNEAFDIEPAKPSWPTRTIVYLDSPSFLIVFKDPKKRFGNEKLANGFFENHKGHEGIKDDRTIRGSVVLEEALRLGFHELKSEELALALDPFTTLRNIVQRSGQQPHSHLPKKHALLKYNAVSVHVPNTSEIQRDLAILNDIYQLKGIYDLLGKNW